MALASPFSAATDLLVSAPGDDLTAQLRQQEEERRRRQLAANGMSPTSSSMASMSLGLGVAGV